MPIQCQPLHSLANLDSKFEELKQHIDLDQKSFFSFVLKESISRCWWSIVAISVT